MIIYLLGIFMMALTFEHFFLSFDIFLVTHLIIFLLQLQSFAEIAFARLFLKILDTVFPKNL